MKKILFFVGICTLAIQACDEVEPPIYGCTDIIACNFNSEASINDESCFYDCVTGCVDSDAFNYNSSANIDNGSCIQEYQVGDYAEGGIVFYVDSTGQRGLVSALEDIGQFEWGCYLQEVNGADGQAIGTGYQNTLDIVAVCSETPIAASEALAYESEGFSDWYLPSKDELVEMYNTIGNSVGGNVGGFSQNLYWSSNMCTTTTGVDDIGGSKSAWHIDFTDGSIDYSNKSSSFKVRPIRSF